MQIDWVTVIAQIINFFVLVWLLHRFLYHPITTAMQRRSARINEQFAEAQSQRTLAEVEIQKFRRMQAELDAERDMLLAEARQGATELRNKLELEARQSLQAQREAWMQQLGEEREAFLTDVRAGALRHIHEVTRAALSVLADSELESEIANRFIHELAKIPHQEAREIAQAAINSGAALAIESGCELPSAVRTRLTKALHEVLSPQLDVHYSTSDDLLLGVRLRAGAKTLEWALSNYLDQLELAVANELGQVNADTEGGSKTYRERTDKMHARPRPTFTHGQ